MKYVEIVVVGIIALGIFAWVAQFVLMVPWIIIQTIRAYFRQRRAVCVKCRAPLVNYYRRPADQMYASVVVKAKCKNGHAVASGDRHFAEW